VAAVDGASLMNVSVRILVCQRLLICSRMTVTAGALRGAGIVRRGPAGVTPRCIRVQAKFLWNYHAGRGTGLMSGWNTTPAFLITDRSPAVTRRRVARHCHALR